MTPISNAGPNQSSSEGLAVTLDGSSSTSPSDTDLSYSWSLNSILNCSACGVSQSDVVLSSTNSENPSFTAPTAQSNYTLRFGLTVSNEDGESETDFVDINIEATNLQPIANAGVDQTTTVSTMINLSGATSSDGDGADLSYLWTVSSIENCDGCNVTTTDIVLNSNEVENPFFLTPDGDTTYYVIRFSLAVSDGITNSLVDTVDIIVEEDIYTIKQNIPFAMEDMSSSTDLVLDDDDNAVVELPFTFSFFNSDYTNIEVDSNGILSLSEAGNGFDRCCQGVSLPGISNEAGNALGAIIAPFWNDLNPGEGGTVSHKTLGSFPNRVFVVDWNNVPFYSNDDDYVDPVSMQVKLFESTNCIEIHCADCNGENQNNGPVTQGIQNDLNDIAFFAPGRNAASALNLQNDAVQFVPNGTTCN